MEQVALLDRVALEPEAGRVARLRETPAVVLAVSSYPWTKRLGSPGKLYRRSGLAASVFQRFARGEIASYAAELDSRRCSWSGNATSRPSARIRS